MITKIYIAIFLAFITSLFGRDTIHIVKNHIKFDDTRKSLSIDYLKNHHDIVSNDATIDPLMIVIHYTGGGTIDSNHRYFNKIEIEGARKSLKNKSNLNVSAHYLIDRDGSIIEILPPTIFARHTIGLNYCAIGIENIGSAKNPLNNKQLDANIQLVTFLKNQYPNITFLIGHHEYETFRNSYLWKERDKNYFTVKQDPGPEFMSTLRDQIQHLKLKSKP